MSRSGYSDDCEYYGIWRGAVEAANPDSRLKQDATGSFCERNYLMCEHEPEYEPEDHARQYGEKPPLPSLDEAWEGIMLEYVEQDFPTSEPYKRAIPGWQCRACGQKVGTSGLPPSRCPKCDAEWDRRGAIFG